MAVVLNASGVNRVRFTVINNMKSLFHPQREIHYIGGTDILPPPLEPEEEPQLITRTFICVASCMFLVCPLFKSEDRILQIPVFII